MAEIELVHIDKKLLMYLLEYLDGYHADQGQTQKWADDFFGAQGEYEDKIEESRLCEGERPRYPRG